VSVFVDTQLLLANEFDDSAALGFDATTEIIYTLTHCCPVNFHISVI
jgi:hypothetical protein